MGNGARNGIAEVVALAEALNAPVLTTFKAKGLLSDSHPLAGGVLGRSGTPVAAWFMNQADLIIVFGASFSDHTGISTTRPIIQVDFDRMMLGKFHAVDEGIWGDGGFGQYMAEFLTAVKYGMNITHVLLNNAELGKISKEQRDGHWPVWQTGLHNPNFADYATLCGGLGRRASSTGELRAALDAALSYDGPALVEVISDSLLT